MCVPARFSYVVTIQVANQLISARGFEYAVYKLYKRGLVLIHSSR